MDDCSTGDKGVSEDISRFCPLSADQSQSACKVTEDLSANDLGNSLTEFLKIHDDKYSGSGYIQPSNKDAIANMKNEAICEDSHKSKLASVNAEKCLKKCATFPCSHKIPSSSASKSAIDKEGVVKVREDDLTAAVLSESGDTKNVTHPFPRSVSLPTPLKLVSAMKGSREKHRTPPPEKMTVSWAPDVYDPLPSAASHVPANRPQRHRNDSKKKGKNKQKGNGKPSRGSRAKDKKQTQKYGGSSNRSFKFLGDDDRVVECDEPRDGIVDFNVGSPDPFCGRSFLKQSVTKLHFSVAEAT